MNLNHLLLLQYSITHLLSPSRFLQNLWAATPLLQCPLNIDFWCRKVYTGCTPNRYTGVLDLRKCRPCTHFSWVIKRVHVFFIMCTLITYEINVLFYGKQYLISSYKEVHEKKSWHWHDVAYMLFDIQNSIVNSEYHA